MEKLGMGGHKESNLTLKDYGLGHKEKGEYEEAIDLLLKAKRVADIELEDDHNWKVMIETQLAPLYHCVGRGQEAKEVNHEERTRDEQKTSTVYKSTSEHI